MTRAYFIRLFTIFLLLSGSVLAKEPNGVYEHTERIPQLEGVYRETWDFREDGTAIFRSTTEYPGIPPATRSVLCRWQTTWLNKNVQIKTSEATGWVVAFVMDGNDLIGTGKQSRARERYRKQ